MIVVWVSILITGNPELFPYPRPWLMSVILLSYLRTSNHPPPLYLSKPLHLKGAVLESDPSGLSQVAALQCPHLKWKTRCMGLRISVDHQLQAPIPYFSAPLIIVSLLLTRQATAIMAIMTPTITITAISRLAQSPGPWRWIWSCAWSWKWLIVLFLYCITVLFMVNVVRWQNRPAAATTSGFIYPRYPLGPPHPPAYIVSCNASWHVTPVASLSGSLWILVISVQTLTGFAIAECFRQRMVLKWPPEVDSFSIALPVHGCYVLHIKCLSSYLRIQSICWGQTVWSGFIIHSSCPVPPGQTTGDRTPPVSQEGRHSGDWTAALPCP